MPVYTSEAGKSNAEVFFNIAKLYFPDGGRVVDMTYGLGVFWRLVQAKNLPLEPTFCDVQDRPGIHWQGDSRQTPFADGEFNSAVIDPPYLRGGFSTKSPDPRKRRGTRDLIYRYGLHTPAILEANTWRKVMRMYEAFLLEARRIVKPGGVIVVKGQDDKTNFFVRDLPLVGCRIEDVHIVTPPGRPMMRHRFQKHARKNHSYFVVLRRLKR